jgi:ABC-type transport system involved in multi-copper enzyme maturation permease subunit
VTIGQQDPQLLSAWPQFAVTVVYAAALLGADAYLFRKRDA